MSRFTLSVRRRDVAWGVALMVLLSAIWVARSDLAEAGGSPPGTGIAVVYIAAGSNFPDALGVGPGGGVNGAPIIILPTDPPIPAASATELVRLDPRSVVIVGGTAAISAAMETALGGLLPNTTITRLAGADRYGTNALFSLNTFPVEGWASIPAAAFTSSVPATDGLNITTGVASNFPTGVLYAPIQLPHGAEILEVKINGFDEDATFDMFAGLYGVNAAGVGSGIVGASTSGTPGFTTVASTTIEGLAIVDNENFAYIIFVTSADSDPYIVSVTVRYRLGVSTG